MVASVKDVAALAVVSPSTVSNYFHRPHLLSPASRERVKAAVEDLGYVPNQSARHLRTGTSRTVGLNLLDAWTPFYSHMAMGVEDMVRAEGWSPFFSNSGRDPERELSNIAMFEAHRVQGLIINPVADVADHLLRLQAKGITCVAVSPAIEHPAIPSIAFDDVRGGELAGEHLLGIGRRRIGFIGRDQISHSNNRLTGFIGRDQISHSNNRLTGLRAAVQRAGGRPGDIRVTQVAALNMAEGLAAATAIMRGPRADWPDALFAANDMLALGVMTGFVRLGVRIPEDIALVGYDDVEYAAMAVTPLTTIRQPSYDMGRWAAEVLLRHINQPSAPVEHISFPGSVVVRESTVGASAGQPGRDA